MASVRASSRIGRTRFLEQDTGSFTRAIGPLFAAFSLPTIAQLVGERPTPWGSVACFLVGTGLLLAGFQFSISDLFPESVGVRKLRAFLTWSGMLAVIVGLGLLAVHAKGLLWAPILILWFVGLALPLICRYLVFPGISGSYPPKRGPGVGPRDLLTPDLPADECEVLLTEIRDALIRLAPHDRESEHGVD